MNADAELINQPPSAAEAISNIRPGSTKASPMELVPDEQAVTTGRLGRGLVFNRNMAPIKLIIALGTKKAILYPVHFVRFSRFPLCLHTADAARDEHPDRSRSISAPSTRRPHKPASRQSTRKFRPVRRRASRSSRYFRYPSFYLAAILTFIFDTSTG